MSTRTEIVSSFYNEIGEDGRLLKTRHGQAFADWYLAFSEKRELLGSTNHLLYICRKL